MSYNQFSSEVSRDDQDNPIGVFSDPNQQNAQNFQQPQVNILQGPGYKLYSAQTQVSKWSWYLRVFGWICLIGGIIKTFGGLIDLMFMEEEVLEIDGPERYEEVEVDMAPLYMEKAVDMMHGVLNIIQGYFVLKTVKTNTRAGSWKLFKYIAIILAIHFVLLCLQFRLIIGAFGEALDEWEDESEGEYTIRNRNGNEFKHKHEGDNEDENGRDWKDRADRDWDENDSQDEDFEEDFRDGYSQFIFMIILTTFAIAFCVTTCCGACVLGGVYKYHYTTKELDIISSMPSVQQVQMQSQIPQYSYSHSQIAPGVSRGQVVAMPPPAIQ
jgi:hypothetical protein